MRTFVIAAALIVSGCVWRSEALQVSADTYQTSASAAPAAGGLSKAQEVALKAANDKCVELHRSINVVNIDSGHDFPANGRATVTFECK